ncbi:MAG: lysozyme [Prevotella sp.]|nr:lysozyme [Prevotella sp.]MBO7539740.1 lysozyme [Prevotella sp.]
MRASESLIQNLKEFEGLRLEAYRDAAGVPTIGYGHTKGVRMGDRLTAYWADQLLRKDVGQVAYEVMQLGVVHTQGQLDALTSFAFNLGIGRLIRSTLLKTIRNGGSMHQIRKEFMRWVYADGKRLKGLEKRRKWEAERFFESEK